MSLVEINGQRIRYEDTGGDGLPLVFSHGFLMDRRMFEPQVEAFAADHRVVTWDERGFGETVFDGRPFTYWDSARDLLGLLDHLDIDRAVLGGMSQGGFISLRAALLAPERVHGLILIDTQAGVEIAENVVAYDQMIETWLAAGPVDELAEIVANIIIAHPDHNGRWIAEWQSRPKELIEQPYRCLMDRDDVTERLAEITHPAVVIHGTEDTAIAMDRAEMLATGLAGAGAVAAVGGAHASNLTNPGPVNDVVRTFLATIER